jgi:hypothetical protein
MLGIFWKSSYNILCIYTISIGGIRVPDTVTPVVEDLFLFTRGYLLCVMFSG